MYVRTYAHTHVCKKILLNADLFYPITAMVSGLCTLYYPLPTHLEYTGTSLHKELLVTLFLFPWVVFVDRLHYVTVRVLSTYMYVHEPHFPIPGCACQRDQLWRAGPG